MKTEEFIQLTISQYHFPKEKEIKLIQLFCNKIKLLGVTNQTQIYRYLTSTLDEWNKSYIDRNTLSLDKEIQHNSGITLIDLIKSSPTSRTNLHDIVEILSKEINTEDINFLEQIIEQTRDGVNLDINEDELIYHIPEITKRLRYTKEVCGKYKEIIQKKIRSITSWYPLKLKIGKFEVDEEILEEVYKAHQLGMSIDRAAKFANTSESVILSCWKAKGLKPQCNGQKPISDEKQDKIYYGLRNKWSIRKTAKYADVNRDTVSKYRQKSASYK